MSIITISQLATIAQNKAGYKGLRGVVNENRQFSRSSQTTSIFLSHAHTDKEKIEQAVTFFRTLGISVYVDWMDHTMPKDQMEKRPATSKVKYSLTISLYFLLQMLPLHQNGAIGR